MRVYETMIILDPDLDEDEARSFTKDRVVDALEKLGAGVRDVDHWGKRDLAYEIRHKRAGYYVIVTADAEPAAMDELGRQLAIADPVFRHKTVRRPDKEREST
ncbi:MAG: 30S ribosomal protein S6 [Acidimicrobiia bacterium]|nr:30S ribosomal protein S6 [Acidimicrobiia bacterium]